MAYNITLTDNEAPVFTAMQNISAVTDDGSCDAVVSFSVTAMDNCDSSPTVTCNPASGSTFPLGVTNVVCTAVDNSSNSAEQEFQVTITGS